MTPFQGRIIAASTHSFLNKVMDLAPPVLIGLALDSVVMKDASPLGAFLSWAGNGAVPADVYAQLGVVAVLTVVIWGLESLFEFYLNRTWRNLAQSVQHRLRLDAYSHVQKLGMDYFADRRTGSLLATINEDVNQLERFINGGANALIQVCTSCIAVGAWFFWASPSIAALAVLPVPFILWGSFRFQASIAPRYAAVREKAADVSGQLALNLSGIETIKAFVAEDRETERIGALSNAYRASNKRAIVLSSAFSPLIRMAVLTGFTATLLWGGYLAVQGDLTPGGYSVLIFLTQRLLWPLTRLGETFDLYQRAMASGARVLDLLDEPIRVEDGTTALPRNFVDGTYRFEDVVFRYPGTEAEVLNGVSFEIPAGQTVAFVGATGAGKSTILRLLLRFHDPTSGRVTLDGHDLSALRLADLRGAVGFVSQSVFLFDGSVSENIRYGAANATHEEVIQAAELAEADGFIQSLPEGYETVVGERGQKLSGGQRQRLSIARALLIDPPVLVLDEATSAVDNETEAAIQRSLIRASEGRTTVIVAHRLSTIRHADRIVVLEKGSVVEQGTHDELLNKDGVYARLWGIQTGDRAKVESQ